MAEITSKGIDDLLSAVGDRTDKLTIYHIGGNALCHYSLKPATADVDVVVASVRERDKLMAALYSCGFKEFTKYEEPSFIKAVRNDFRIDIFTNSIGFIRFSREMKRRAITHRTFGSVRSKLCSKEDIFLFKAITERHEDLVDLHRLLNADVKPGVILAELRRQAERHHQLIDKYKAMLARLEEAYGLTLPAFRV